MSELPLPTVETRKVRTPVNGLQPALCEVPIVDAMATLCLTLERMVVQMGHQPL